MRLMRHTGPMFALVFGMLVCLVGGMVVMGFVAAQSEVGAPAPASGRVMRSPLDETIVMSRSRSGMI